MPVSGGFAALSFLSLPGSCVSGPSGGVGKHGLLLAFPELVFFQYQLIELTAHLPLQGPLTQLQLLQLQLLQLQLLQLQLLSFYGEGP